MARHTSKGLTSKQIISLFTVLKTRFEKNMKRHNGFAWAAVQARLEVAPEKC